MAWIFLFFIHPVVTDQNINNLEQDHPFVVKYIREELLEPLPMFPNPIEEMDLSIENTSVSDLHSLHGQFQQALFLEEFFKPFLEAENATKRFFIEAGSYDGILHSNTLRLELNSIWTGLLVEPDPNMYKLTRSRERNCMTLPACFSITKKN